MQKMLKNKGFSLTELSVVIVVISLIIASIVKSGSMISTSRIATARSLTNKSIVQNIGGLIAWYETSKIESFKVNETTNNSQISTWYDNNPASVAQQKNALTRTASSTVLYKTNGINSLPSIQFSGSSSARISVSTLSAGPAAAATVFVVMQPTSALSSTAKVPFDSGSSNSFYGGVKSAGILMYAGSSYTNSAANSMSAGQNYIVAFYINGTASKAYINNATSTTGGTLSPGTANVLTGFNIGSVKDGTGGCDCLISETIVYNRTLKLEERKDIMRYLAKKYAISVTGI